MGCLYAFRVTAMPLARKQHLARRRVREWSTGCTYPVQLIRVHLGNVARENSEHALRRMRHANPEVQRQQWPDENAEARRSDYSRGTRDCCDSSEYRRA